MKKLRIVGVGIAVLLLAACTSENLEPDADFSSFPLSSSSQPAALPSATLLASASSHSLEVAVEPSEVPLFSPTTKGQALFLALLMGGKSEDNFEDTDLVDAYERGQAICVLYEGGWTHDEVTILLQAAAGNPYTEEQMTNIWGSALTTLCPEYAKDLLD